MTTVAIKYAANLITSFKVANVGFYSDADSTHMGGQKSRWQKARGARDEVWRRTAGSGENGRRSWLDILRSSGAGGLVNIERIPYAKIPTAPRFSRGRCLNRAANPGTARL